MYRIRGGDGLEYGPVESDKITQWIRERRLDRSSLVQKGTGELGWVRLGELPEFGDVLRSVEIPPPLLGYPASPGGVPPNHAHTSPTAPPSSVPLSSYPSSQLGGSAADARAAVEMPAILLIIYGGLSLISHISGLLFNSVTQSMNSEFFFQSSNFSTQGMPPWLTKYLQTALQHPPRIALGEHLIGLVLAGVIIWGAIEMKRLGSRSLAMVAAILAVIPCLVGCCCCIGIPLGVWALVLLNRPNISRYYRS